MIQVQQLKLIFKGRLEFGSKRSFDMAMRHWQTRLETYFKSDILFKAEQVFEEPEFVLSIPQQILMNSEKSWRSTTALLMEVAQYAIVGNIGAWCVDNGHLVDYQLIEPKSEKSAVAEFILGRQLVQEGAKYDEASAALSRAIEKYERHALAYERRGYVNYKLQNYNDALHDFDKSITINPNNPDPYYGRGKVKTVKNDWDGAVSDYENTIKRSLALQPIYWLARLKKGECLLHAKKQADAVKEFKLFLQRNFQENDPNSFRKRRAYLMMGKAFLECGQTKEAIEALDQAMAMRKGAEFATDRDILLQRGMAKQKAGVAGFENDLQDAADMGCSEAARMLAS